MDDYCQNLVRTCDYNRYLLSFFIPRRTRQHAIAILALNVELESIPTKTTDPMAALIRLQWWRDEIQKIYQEDAVLSDSPILSPLANAVKELNMPINALTQLFDCYDDIIRGTPKDPDDMLYTILSYTLDNDKERNKFSKRLQLHDKLSDNAPLRAWRLWFGV